MRASDTVEIGETGLRVSRLGLGGVALSGAPPSTDPQSPTPEDEAVALIRRSLALGLSYLDTAPMYGVGESERRYGRALGGVARDSYVLSTKVGRVLRAGAGDGARMTWAFDFSADGVRESIGSSLERLGLSRIDILFVHDPDEHYQTALEQAFPVLVEMRAQGRVRAIGAGMNQWQMELAFAREGMCDCFLLAGRYTLWTRAPWPSSCRTAWSTASAWWRAGPTTAGSSPSAPGPGRPSTTGRRRQRSWTGRRESGRSVPATGCR